MAETDGATTGAGATGATAGAGVDGLGATKSIDDVVKWEHSDAKRYLYKLIVSKKIPERDAIAPREVFAIYCKDRPEFVPFQDTKNFASRLRSLREKAQRRGESAELDAECLAHDRKIFAAPTVDTKVSG